MATGGATEEELREGETPYRVGQVPYKANARARCTGETDGIVKIIAHEETDRILGVHIVGANASELIAEWSWRRSTAPPLKA